MRAGGARRAGGLVWPLRVPPDAHVPRGQVHDGRGYEEGRDLARAALQQCAVLTLDDVEPADAAADVDPDAVVDFRRDLQPGHADGFITGCHGQVDEPSHFLHFFFVNEIERVEVADFRGNLAGEL